MIPGRMFGAFVIAAGSRAGRRKSFMKHATRVSALLATCILFCPAPAFGQSATASGGAPSAGAALAAKTSAPDFARLLSDAVDKAAVVEDAVHLLTEYVSYVKDGASRRSLLLRLAALQELLGQWEEAAARYEEAAYAAPEPGDSGSLIAGARAYLAAGETEKALSILKILKIVSSDPIVRARAGILEGWAGLITGGTAEAKGIAERSAVGISDAQTQLAALVLLWAASEGAERTKAADRMRRAFPDSPEAAMAETGNIPTSAHWLLTPASGAASPEGAPRPGSAVPTGQAVASSAAPPPTQAAAPVPEEKASGPDDKTAAPASGGISAFQVGAFAQEVNAAALVRELGAKGFAVSLERGEQGGRPIWRVLVPAGTSAQNTLLRLKDAGYESYPVF